MGQRLVCTIETNEKKLCNIYFHWSAYTYSALLETKKIIDTAYARARNILTEHIDKLHAVAKVLLEKEKIDGEEFDSIFAE